MRVFGLDAGGTKTELLARNPATGEERRLSGPAANMQRAGADGVAEVLAALILEAMGEDAGPVAAFAGVAGAGRPDDQQTLAGALKARLPANVVVGVTHDADIALEGAFGGRSGIVVIAGTGSVVVARTMSGAIERAGGWGYLLGDEGSGYAVGIAALRCLTAVFDGDDITPFTARLRDELDLPDGPTLIKRVYREGWPVQRAAPIVCAAAAAGDADAGEILATEAMLLAAQVGRLCRRCGDVSPQIAFLGGLSREAAFSTRLGEAIVAQVPHARVVAPLATPVEGAWQRALRLHTAS
jgi:glucosamine kinase